MEQEESPKLDLGSLGSFDFTPDWAKKDAGVTVGKVRPERDRPAFGDKTFFLAFLTSFESFCDSSTRL